VNGLARYLALITGTEGAKLRPGTGFEGWLDGSGSDLIAQFPLTLGAC